MGTGRRPEPSDSVSPPAQGDPMSPAEHPEPAPEVARAVQHLLASQPGFPIPAEAHARIAAALAAEAATRAALLANDVEPAPPAVPFDKDTAPVEARERDES